MQITIGPADHRASVVIQLHRIDPGQILLTNGQGVHLVEVLVPIVRPDLAVAEALVLTDLQDPVEVVAQVAIVLQAHQAVEVQAAGPLPVGPAQVALVEEAINSRGNL